MLHASFCPPASGRRSWQRTLRNLSRESIHLQAVCYQVDAPTRSLVSPSARRIEEHDPTRDGPMPFRLPAYVASVDRVGRYRYVPAPPAWPQLTRSQSSPSCSTTFCSNSSSSVRVPAPPRCPVPPRAGASQAAPTDTTIRRASADCARRRLGRGQELPAVPIY